MYDGQLKFLLSLPDENSNRTFEWDGCTESYARAADTFTLPSYSALVISNVTAIGIGKDGTSSNEDKKIGLEIHDNAGRQVWKSTFTEFAKSIIEVEKTDSTKVHKLQLIQASADLKHSCKWYHRIQV